VPRKKPRLTDAGVQLLATCLVVFERLETTLQDLRARERAKEGSVAFGSTRHLLRERGSTNVTQVKGEWNPPNEVVADDEDDGFSGPLAGGDEIGHAGRSK
jgi:hypothetical protein